jgi:hypothetical protein
MEWAGVVESLSLATSLDISTLDLGDALRNFSGD